MQKFVLNSEEIASIQQLLAEIAARYDSAEDPAFLMECTVLAAELPRRLRLAMNEFRIAEPDSALFVISGYPVDDQKIGPTPEHWDLTAEQRRPALEEEILFALTCSLLGDCIGWSTQQNGRILHDVMPIKGMEQEQIGTGSEQLITWHTEDAFHPMSGDYVALMFLRNRDRVPTTFASLENLGLSDEDWDTLFEPHYFIHADNSHRPENAAHHGESDVELAELYDTVAQAEKTHQKVPILSGDRKSPYIKIDPYFMDPVEDNPRAQKAFEALCRAIDAKIADYALAPGEICFVDNRKAVHGRRAFKARYDGTDRWFKRTNITRDLRLSRPARRESTSRILH
jgi:Fe(II)/alpha-ketoglutarate-dependent arginine beta-hydroxylase